MSTVKIKTSDRNEYQTTRITSFGPIEFDEKGFADVQDSETASKLCKASPSLTVVGDLPQDEPDLNEKDV